MTLASPLQADLVSQLRVPGGWEVLVGAHIAAGWLGAISAPVAVLAPGPGGTGAHRTQLIVFVAPDPASDRAADPAPNPATDRERGLASRRAPVPASDRPRTMEGADHGLAMAAAAGIPEAWCIDPARGWTEVFRAPWDGRYRSRTLCLPGEAIVPLALTRLRVVPLSRPCAR